MAKESVFTMKLEAELREDFMAEAHAVDRPASQVVRELMREFILRQRQQRGYRDFLQDKVDRARRDAGEAGTVPAADVELAFKSLRAAHRHGGETGS